MAESARHQSIKKEISRLFEQEGWSAEEEARGQGWRADCLVEKDGRRAAIEVELSKPSIPKIIPRIETYKADDIASVWLVDKNSRFPDRGDLPIFPIEKTPTGEMVYLDKYHTVTLQKFLLALSERRLRRQTPKLSRQRAGAMILFGYDCYHCHKQMSIWCGGLLAQCVCERSFNVWEDIPKDILEEERRKRWDPLYAPFGPPAFYKKSSTAMTPLPYYAARCPHCNRLQGDFYVERETSYIFLSENLQQPSEDLEVHFLSSERVGSKHLEKIEQRHQEENDKHWCLERR